MRRRLSKRRDHGMELEVVVVPLMALRFIDLLILIVLSRLHRPPAQRLSDFALIESEKS